MKKPKDFDLNKALSDWSPEAEEKAPLEISEETSAEKTEASDNLTFVQDWDGIDIDQIRKAQLNDEPLTFENESGLLEMAEESAPAIAPENAEAAVPTAEASTSNEEASLPDHASPEAEGELEARPPSFQNIDELAGAIESLLFVADKSLSLKKLQEIFAEDAPEAQILEALEKIKGRYQGIHYGFELVEVNGGYQFRTPLAHGEWIRRMSVTKTQRLSTGAMESLSIIAYRQPCTKDLIDQIRGVDSSHFIRMLMERKLIQIQGRSEEAGRPMIYETTSHFLELFQLNSLNDLPALREVEQLVPMSETDDPIQKDPRLKQISKLISEMRTESESGWTETYQQDEEILKSIQQKIRSISVTTPTLELKESELKEEAKTELWSQLESTPAPVESSEPTKES